MPPPARIIIDTDPGVDDAIAIMMAMADPAVDVLGLTSVGGNVSLSQATRNALALLEYAKRSNIPVARGASRPRRGSFPYARYYHGQSGLTRRLPKPATRTIAIGAVDFLARRVDRYPGQIGLVALGPLTNLARLERRYPKSLQGFASLTVMGGAVGTPGNVTSHAEFNFYSDSVAAHEVLTSGVALTLVDLGACRRVYLNRGSVADLGCDDQLGALVVELLRNWFEIDQKRERFEFCDPLAWAAAIDPGILTTRPVTIEVETGDPLRIGESRVLHDRGPVSVVEQVDHRRFFGLLARLLKLPQLAPADN